MKIYPISSRNPLDLVEDSVRSIRLGRTDSFDNNSIIVAAAMTRIIP